jgi:imidazolonepropionase-like amidohydrolase
VGERTPRLPWTSAPAPLPVTLEQAPNQTGREPEDPGQDAVQDVDELFDAALQRGHVSRLHAIQGEGVTAACEMTVSLAVHTSDTDQLTTRLSRRKVSVCQTLFGQAESKPFLSYRPQPGAEM